MDHSISTQAIESLRTRINHIYRELAEVSSQLSDLEKSALPPPAEELRAAHPRIKPNPDILALVGTLPMRSLEEDKSDLRDILTDRFE